MAIDERRPSPRMASRPYARSLFERLGARGFQAAEAGNMAAYLIGLAPVETGWSVREIERLLFLRYLVDRGSVTS